MTITFIGHGYVGLVTACIFANLGNIVFVIGRNKEKINQLKKGNPLIFEPGLSEILKKNLLQKRLIFTTSYEKSIPFSEVIFIAVGTPPKNNGEADLSSIFEVAEKIGKNLKKYAVVVCKSTVPPGTNKKIKEIIEKNKPKSVSFDIASCPEFLREGTAIYDTLFPDRIVIGSNSKKATDILLELHRPLEGKRLIVGLESAEMIKYASNAFLATKISFANLIAFLCEKTGADVEEVLEGVGLDKRIGRVFLYPGVGYGGSCLPKDVKALIKTGQQLKVNMDFLEAVKNINDQAKKNLLEKIFTVVKDKKITIWGLSFKPNTDDVREAPSIFIIKELLNHKFKIKVYDPEAMKNVRKIFDKKIEFCDNPYQAVIGSSALVILTEWDEFKQIDLIKIKKLMRDNLVIDGRNIYSPEKMKKLGFNYISVGRKL